MSDDLTARPSGGPPAGWYDAPDGTGRQRWYDGSVWTEHYQGAQPTASPPAVPTAQPATLKGRDNAQYVRQQKGHSVIKHWVLLGWATLWILPIYYTVSKNHYWHA